MVVLRKFVGWLSFLSFLASVALFGMWVYVIASPYFRGMVVWKLPQHDLHALGKRFSQSNIGIADNLILRDYVTRDVEPMFVATGFDAAVMAPRQPVLKRTSAGTAAALLDPEHGIVLAAYPADLTGQQFPLPEGLLRVLAEGFEQIPRNLEIRQRWEHPAFYDWQINFLQQAGGFSCPPYSVAMNTVRDESGEVIAVLAVAYHSSPFVLESDSGKYDMPEWLLKSSGFNGSYLKPIWPIPLLLSLLLLPIWVGFDSAWRGMRPFPWTLLILLTSFIGLFAYLIARLAPPCRCPNCGEMVLAKYKRCPVCGLSIFTRCKVCRSRMKPGWQYCPVCNEEGVPPADESLRHELIVTADSEPELPESTLPRLALATAPQVRVQVCDAVTGDPLADVSLCIEGASVVRASTNGQGSFEARTLIPGAYSIMAHRSGYAPSQIAVDIDEEFHDTADILLRPLPGALAGKIVDRTSLHAVAGAQVYLDSGRADISTISEIDGNYILKGVPAGVYTVRVDCSGFLSQVKLTEVAPGQHVSLDFGLERSAVTEEDPR